MLDKNIEVKVLNRSSGYVGYEVPELNVSRMFSPKETKDITMNELRQLNMRPGGHELLWDYLIIRNDEAVKELLGDIEPEYSYTEEEVRYLLTKGSVDQLRDCLNFGNAGVKELIKKLSVELEIDSYDKRNAIQEILSFNVTKAINISKEDYRIEKVSVERKAKPVTITEEPAKPNRKAAPLTK